MDGVLVVDAIAFGSPSWNESAERLAGYRTRAIEGTARADFTLAIARNDDGRVVGFATARTLPTRSPPDACTTPSTRPSCGTGSQEGALRESVRGLRLVGS